MNYIRGSIKKRVGHSSLGSRMARSFSSGRSGADHLTDSIPSDMTSDASSNMPSGMRSSMPSETPSLVKNEADLVLHTSGGEMPDSNRPPVDRATLGETGDTGETGKKVA